MRMGEPYPNMERSLLKQFQKYARKQIGEQDTDWHRLSVAVCGFESADRRCGAE
jgi:hypothetical protein